jgi:hypothetical protein
MTTFAANDYVVPRTTFGDPNLEGIWTNATVTPVERPDWMPKATLTAEEARQEARSAEFGERGNEPTDPDAGAPEKGDDVGGYNSFWIDAGTKVAQVNGEYRTSIVVDPPNGKIPYKPAARARLFAMLRDIAVGMDGPEQRPLGERCIVGFGSTGGPPMLPVLYNNHYQIVQSPGYVMILVEMNHDARIVRLGGEHPDPSVRPWLGDSIGRWEGNTLVIETTNMNPGQSLRECIRHRVYFSPNVKVIERLTRVGKDEIFYEFTIDDPDAFTQTWRGCRGARQRARSTNTPATKGTTRCRASSRARASRRKPAPTRAEDDEQAEAKRARNGHIDTVVDYSAACPPCVHCGIRSERPRAVEGQSDESGVDQPACVGARRGGEEGRRDRAVDGRRRNAEHLVARGHQPRFVEARHRDRRAGLSGEGQKLHACLQGERTRHHVPRRPQDLHGLVRYRRTARRRGSERAAALTTLLRRGIRRTRSNVLRQRP